MKIPQVDPKACLAAMGGVMTSLAHPHVEWSILAWIGPGVLLALLYQTSPSKGWRLGGYFGVAHYLSLMYWIAPTLQTYAPMPMPLALATLGLLSFYLAFYLAAFGGLTAWLGRTPLRFMVLTPVLWVAIEFARGRLLSGFPWGLLGYTQYKWLALIQITEFTGPYGVSAVIMLVNGAVGLLLVRLMDRSGAGLKPLPTWRQWAISAGVTVVVFGLVLGWGQWRQTVIETRSLQAETLRVAVIQGNIDQTRKWVPKNRKETLDTYFLLSAEARGNPSTPAPDLVIWPETAIPFYLSYEPVWALQIRDGVRRMGAALLSGGPTAEKKAQGYRYYNSAYLLDTQGQISGRYDKRHLVPFGEYVPFKQVLFFINKLVTAAGDFTIGRDQGSLNLRKIPINTLICYEIIFPHLVRQHHTAGLIVNITNDAWFGSSGGPYQHFSTAVFRSIENRRSMARAANTGISGFILPSGRISGTTHLNVSAQSVADLPILTEATFYNQNGDLLAWFCSLAVFLVTAGSVYRERIRP